MADPGGRELVEFLDGYEEEAATRAAETPLVDAELNAAFLRGNQTPGNLGPPSPYRPESSQYQFTMNVVNQLVKRHVALLTDSRPRIDVLARQSNMVATALVYKSVTEAIWDETNFEQLSARELVRAATIGSTICIPMWDETANYGRGDIAFQMVDPRRFKLDPSVVHAVDVQRLAEFAMMREVVPLNAIRERYTKGVLVQPSTRWSTYGTKRAPQGVSTRGITTAMQTPWRRRDEEPIDSMSPRAEVRHTWFRDYARDAKGEALMGPRHPRHIRYVVDAEGIVLKDERMVYQHGQIPAHVFDWDIEFEHPYGIPMVSGLRRMQYTLNRIIGQVMDNVIMTNRVKVISDANAVDPKTWDAITANPNGIYIRKRQGHTFQYELPANVVPPYVISVIQLLLQSMDLVTGMTEATSGRMPKGTNISGVALDALQIQAQSVVRLIARTLESWLERIFQQVLGLIWQYYCADRIMHLVDAAGDVLQFEFNRQKFLTGDDGNLLATDAWQDFEFKVLPGSSLASTRIQRGVMALNLRQAGLLAGVDVLRAAEWPNPEEAFQRAQEELASGGGPGARTSRRMLKVPGATRRDAISL